LWVIVFYVAYVFPVSDCQISAGLAYVCFVACFACHFVYAAFVVFLRGILESGFDQLLQAATAVVELLMMGMRMGETC
jgi:hypothetical protein